ncbi:hypothetical protein PIB30_046428 [Stylosanthes scabra]|uniref:Uncharacterized protein n=1 Tax=Stylosanthes scabra TaxID=79078 RepID=A0ABU6WGH1_9FABA|nr:hypothetical protein [Stylosanthes scabra]
MVEHEFIGWKYEIVANFLILRPSYQHEAVILIRNSVAQINSHPKEFLQRENFSTEIIENILPEDLQPTVKLCIDVKRLAAAKLRLLAKNRADNIVLIAESDRVLVLVRQRRHGRRKKKKR